MYRLFGCPIVLDSKCCAVIRTPDNGYAFGLFHYPRRTFEEVATYTYMADAKRAFDAYNRAMRHWRKAAWTEAKLRARSAGDGPLFSQPGCQRERIANGTGNPNRRLITSSDESDFEIEPVEAPVAVDA